MPPVARLPVLTLLPSPASLARDRWLVRSFARSPAPFQFGGALTGAFVGAVSAAFKQGPVAAGLTAGGSVAGTIGVHSALMAGVGGSFLLGECMCEGVRGKRDWVNSIAGGFAAGQVLGIHARSMHVAAGAGLGLAIVGVMVEASGGARDSNPSDRPDPMKKMFAHVEEQ
jgi:hypothetical protein